MKKLMLSTAALMLMFAVSCEKSPMRDMQPNGTSLTSQTVNTTTQLDKPGPTPRDIRKTKAYFGNQLYTIRVEELQGKEAEELLARPDCIVRTLYVAPTLYSSPTLDPRVSYQFLPVLNNIHNSAPFEVYVEKVINYYGYGTADCTPWQFTSSNDVLNAVYHHRVWLETNGKVALITVMYDYVGDVKN